MASVASHSSHSGVPDDHGAGVSSGFELSREHSSGIDVAGGCRLEHVGKALREMKAVDDCVGTGFPKLARHHEPPGNVRDLVDPGAVDVSPERSGWAVEWNARVLLEWLRQMQKIR